MHTENFLSPFKKDDRLVSYINQPFKSEKMSHVKMGVTLDLWTVR